MSWLITQASLLAVVLSVSLNSYDMAQGHIAMMPDASVMDHSAHAAMNHADHDMTSSGFGLAHEGHANCPMIACCHTGGVGTLAIPALTGASTCKHVPSAKLYVDKAAPESAKKPPRNV